MQLPNTIEITGPRATRIRIAALITPQGKQGLQLRRNREGVKMQLLRGNNSGEKGVQVHEHTTALPASSSR